jgi:hypothetical protein
MKSLVAKRLSVSISEETLRRLLSTDQLCAADLNCLNRTAQYALRRLCLESCMGPLARVDKRRHRFQAALRGPAVLSKDHRTGVYSTFRGHLKALFTAKCKGGQYCGESE